MKIGAIYPQTELGGDPAALGAIARSAETQGYDYFVMFDHVAGAVRENRDPPLWGPYTDKDPFHDPFVSFGYLACLTSTLELVTGVMVLPQRETVLVARQAADVDLLSGGRLRLGVGVGWNHVEFEALGQDFHRRGRRMDEQLSLLRQLWAGAPVDFAGAFHRIDRVALNPAPRRRIPIYCGGLTEPAFRRAAALADGFIFGGGSFEEMVLPAWRKLQGYLAEAGRSLADFGADYQVPNGTSAADAVDLIRRWEDAGGTHAAVRSLGCGFTSLPQHIDYFADVQTRLRR